MFLIYLILIIIFDSIPSLLQVYIDNSQIHNQFLSFSYLNLLYSLLQLITLKFQLLFSIVFSNFQECFYYIQHLEYTHASLHLLLLFCKYFHRYAIYWTCLLFLLTLLSLRFCWIIKIFKYFLQFLFFFELVLLHLKKIKLNSLECFFLLKS